jgi:uncharacterized protein YabN with tetrapyrrole methylase and pyrophosphatase domain
MQQDSSNPIFSQAKEQGQYAASFGFDWTTSADVMFKVLEETQELQVAINENDRDGIRHEIGDVLLALSSLARHNELSLETAFQDAIQRFQSRWDKMTVIATESNIEIEALMPSEWENLWEKAKVELDNNI